MQSGKFYNVLMQPLARPPKCMESFESAWRGLTQSPSPGTGGGATVQSVGCVLSPSSHPVIISIHPVLPSEPTQTSQAALASNSLTPLFMFLQ